MSTYGLAVDGVEVLTKSIGTLEGFFECFGLYPGSDAMTFMDDGNGNVVWGGENAEKAKEALAKQLHKKVEDLTEDEEDKALAKIGLCPLDFMD